MFEEKGRKSSDAAIRLSAGVNQGSAAQLSRSTSAKKEPRFTMQLQPCRE
ncbi:hypothetical protein HBH56_000140 [Parastagonospora nodorum]|uniref:Uncharacterized protein n=1 Tax=Phaeosphaeria nodorum (strain SN15 / ATCC MYA-4574 / FGSC 10173) TaxID=321614 RepID=A0A7U2ENB9_PHANO|nr:hypothetical protein HBH56_000140 [Parastagonospora nodorum]QRC90025.1 hypothetical protein JI435_400000 [Parastagonospora nodorum SN15]KAH3937853.1 hypothetical protein HBH54_000150 [Parastagonospora nodorum]KAH4035872.1 hypothetical protein HBI09_093020 [Parastagonospora nodorum]KAH4145671.1 hypothetical protein HBH45_012380 [Parastagonospora nodorum]